MTSRRQFVHSLTLAGGAISLSGWPRTARHAGSDHPSPSFAGPPPAARALRILILGGTGLTGPHQVRYALERGHQVTVFNRGRRNERLPKGVTELQGDRQLKQLDALKGKEWDVVLDNPTTLPFWVRDMGALLRDRVGHYVFTSSLSVYDPAGQSSITEESPLLEYTEGDPLAVTQAELSKRFEFLFGRMKTASEREARKWFGDRTTIIRPCLIIGPGDGTFRFTYWPHRIAQGGEVLAPGDGTDLIQLIDCRDLAEFTVRMAEQKVAGVFNASGPRSAMTMAEQLHAVRGALDGTLDVRFTWVPSEFLAAQKVAPWQEMTTWIPKSDPEWVLSNTSNTRAVRAGLTFRPLAVSAVDALAWYRALPEATRTQVGKAAGLAPEKERAVLDAWRAARGR